MNLEQPPGRGTSPAVWIIAALVVLCLCGAVLAVVGGAGYLFFITPSNALTGAPTGVVQAVTVEAIPVTSTPPPAPTGSAPTEESSAAGLEVEEINPGEPLHEDEGTPIQYNSNPPVGGRHYPVWVEEAGLYEEIIADGYLVHNLEHGYVIIWYGCDQLSDAECETLKDDIQSVIDYFDGYKVIGMPRPDMPAVLALTSWGRLARLDEFNFDLMVEFIERYQEDSPEPNAP